MRAAYVPYRLVFKSPSGTSRGILTYKDTYFLKVWDENTPEHYGVGECALFRGLSKEDSPYYEDKLKELCSNISLGEPTDLSAHSSILFGLESALYDYSNGGRQIYYPSAFTSGAYKIRINGLIWMGNKEEMRSRIDEKVKAGFHTLKLKVGALDFESELSLIKYIREKYSATHLEIRLDANCGFSNDSVMSRLDKLSKFDIHSIEQPIKVGQWDFMNQVCTNSPIPIALDEELIGITDPAIMESLLTAIRPKYIILKPSLMGGISGSAQWLQLAAQNDIGGWITSALESNVGLNTIAQWTATLQPLIPQGLGTGLLFTNNFDSPLYQDSEYLCYDASKNLNLPDVFSR